METIIIVIICYVVFMCAMTWCNSRGHTCYYAPRDNEEIVAELDKGFNIDIVSETEVQSSSITNIGSEDSEISIISIVDDSI